MRSTVVPAIDTVLVLRPAAPTRSETPAEWVTLCTRVHGGGGMFIPAETQPSVRQGKKAGKSLRYTIPAPLFNPLKH